MGRARHNVATYCKGNRRLRTTRGQSPPVSLHAEDTAFAVAILAGLGIRSSVERTRLTAPRCVGGLQLASVVECAVGAVSSELMFLLNGSTLASDLARDTLQEAMLSPVDH